MRPGCVSGASFAREDALGAMAIEEPVSHYDARPLRRAATLVQPASAGAACRLTLTPWRWIGGTPVRAVSNRRILGAVFASPVHPRMVIAGDHLGDERFQLSLPSARGETTTPLAHAPQAMFHFGGWAPDGARLLVARSESSADLDLYEPANRQRLYPAIAAFLARHLAAPQAPDARQ
jgi:hypothetical protein